MIHPIITIFGSCFNRWMFYDYTVPFSPYILFSPRTSSTALIDLCLLQRKLTAPVQAGSDTLAHLYKRNHGAGERGYLAAPVRLRVSGAGNVKAMPGPGSGPGSSPDLTRHYSRVSHQRNL